MKKLITLILTLSLFAYTVFAETIKTDVLVIGNGASAVTAAIQSSRSKLKTVLLVKGDWLADMQGKEMITVAANNKLPSGFWGEFRKHVNHFYKGTPGRDTTHYAPLKFESFAGAGILKKIADTTKLLTIKINAAYTEVEKDGTGWKITYTHDGRTDFIKAKTLVDATEQGEVVSAAGATLPPPVAYGANLYRTSIATGDDLVGQSLGDAKNAYPATPAYYIPMSALVVKDADNLFITDKALVANASLPVQMAIGQGVGTMAAYCAFFKTTTKYLKVRIIQGELLDFRGYLLPFDDITPTDKYFKSIQQIAATGLLKGAKKLQDGQEQFLFMPDSAVTTDEIKPVLSEIYSRAFIWFNNTKPADKFTVGNLLSFISEITLTEPKYLRSSMQRDWKTKYKFKTDFDIDRPVQRREFAILANQFLNPFARTVDLSGRMIN
ncbi:MAG: FAD-dependent oxidoreductase [Bacteroidota bacterium]